MKNVIGMRFKGFWKLVSLIFTVILMSQCLYGCGNDDPDEEDFKTEYQAVLLTNGTYYFGKIEKIWPNFIELKDVYYIKSEQNQRTKIFENKLFSRRKELYLPDHMFVNNKHIVSIEPVSSSSVIVQIIKGSKTGLHDTTFK